MARRPAPAGKRPRNVVAPKKVGAIQEALAAAYEGMGGIDALTLEKAIAALTRKQDSAVAWTIATLVTMLGGAIGMIFALVTRGG